MSKYLGNGTPGARYLVSGASLTMDEAVALVRGATGKPDRVVWVPRVVARLARPVAAGTARLARGSDTAICPALIRTLLHGHRYDSSRSERELGVTYRPVHETLERALAWYEDRGVLARRPA